MKSILMITALLVSVFAFGQEKQPPEPIPNALTSVEAGCLVMPAKEAIVLQCQKCIKAKTKWAKSKR